MILDALHKLLFWKDDSLDNLKSISNKLNILEDNTKKLRELNTELLRAQQIILEQDNKIRMQTRILNNLDMIMVITDIDANIIYANNAFEKAFEYEPQELVGQNARILKSGQHPDDFYQNLWKTIKSGKVWSDIIISKTKSGKLIKYTTTITPVYNGEIKYFIAIKKIHGELT